MMSATSNRKCSLFIDHSHTSASGYQTGVQRVVRKICEHAVHEDHRFQSVNLVTWAPHGFQTTSACEPLRQSRKKNLAHRISCWIQGIFQGQPRESRGKDSDQRANSQASFQENDVLLLPDAYWAYPDIWPTVDRLREQGVKTAVVIYDLIPHTHSEIYGEQGAEGFRNYIRLACKHADCLLAISQTVREQLIEHLPGILAPHPLPMHIGSFPLGADFQSSTGKIRNELANFLQGDSDETPYLMVGTIEARKNHPFALDAMEQLWKIYPNRRLCIVGQPGWRGESATERILQHPKYGTQLAWFQNVNDAEVQFCYQNSKGVLFPSLTEGFGLPIVESLWHQKATFASDIQIHRESGKNLCRYFSLDNPQHLARLLIENEKAIEANEVIDRDALITPWNRAVHDLLQIVHETLAHSASVTHSAALDQRYAKSA